MAVPDLLHPCSAPARAADHAPGRRLESLQGKRVAMVKNAWPSWHEMADRLGTLLRERIAGSSWQGYLIPNGSAAEPASLQQIASSNDCAIVGLANCGSCTAWSLHDAAELANAGLPVVLVVTREFTGLVDAIAAAKSIDLPTVTLPVNPETIDRGEAIGVAERAYDAIVGALTGPHVPGPAGAGDGVPASGEWQGQDRLGVFADEEEAQEELYRRGWTDGLPVTLPTVARVERMLRGLACSDPHAVIAAMPPSGHGVTYQTLAVNAVMAGCDPQCGPALAALARAVCEPGFNLNGIATTTGPSTPMAIVSGPAGTIMRMNSGRGALGPGNRANATVGRALRLLIANVGGARPGEVSKSIMGQPGRYTFCFAEDNDASPWAPLHATLGLDAGQSAVTVVGATGSMNLLTPRRDVDAMLTLLGDGLAFMGNPNVVMGKGTVAVLLSPGHARAMAAAGLSKADVAQKIWERASIPIERFPAAAHPDPPYEFAERGGLIYPVADPSHVLVVVVGGPEPTHATLVPSHPSSVPAVEPIRV